MLFRILGQLVDVELADPITEVTLDGRLGDKGPYQNNIYNIGTCRVIS